MDLEQIVRLFTMTLGALLCGMAFFVFTIYAPYAWANRQHKTMVHIALLSACVVILTAVQLSFQTNFLIRDRTISLQTGFSGFAYLVGLLGLWNVLQGIRDRIEAGQSKRRTDKPLEKL